MLDKTGLSIPHCPDLFPPITPLHLSSVPYVTTAMNLSVSFQFIS